jgi:hypothetical protein
MARRKAVPICGTNAITSTPQRRGEQAADRQVGDETREGRLHVMKYHNMQIAGGVDRAASDMMHL